MKDYNNVSIVYIDDNEVPTTVAKTQFKKYGIELVTGTSGKELFEILETKSFDLIILDDMMPEMSGTEVMQKLKADGHTKPIVVLTGKGDKEEFLEAGFDDHIEKSRIVEEIPRILSKYFG